MEFRADYRNYITRYFGGPAILIVAIFSFFLASLLKGFSFFGFVEKLFSSDIRSILYFFSFTIIYQIVGYLSTNKHPKLLILDKDYLIFYFFKKPALTLKYSEIRSLEYTKDVFKDFDFTLKDGEKKMVYAKLSDNQKAFEEMNKRIRGGI